MGIIKIKQITMTAPIIVLTSWRGLESAWRFERYHLDWFSRRFMGSWLTVFTEHNVLQIKLLKMKFYSNRIGVRIKIYGGIKSRCK